MSVRFNFSILALFLVISLSTSLTVQADIPPVEREALIALYNSTDGGNWNSRENWRNAGNTDFNAVGTECTWQGVSCDLSENSVATIILSGNQLNGTIPPELGNLSGLTSLYLGGNQLSGSIPPALGNLSNLTILYLHMNQLSGSIPPELGNLSALTSLTLSSNQLSGSIPPALGNLSALTSLALSGNQLSGSIPPALGNLSALTSLSLTSNQLSGSIPPELGNLSVLTSLGLHRNQLSGSIPAALGNLSGLRSLYLGGNQLTGGIPPELGNLTSLTWLDLEGNNLTGLIAPAIGDLTNLRTLKLGGNQLTGRLPAEFGNLSELDWLTLERNNLQGPLPGCLWGLSRLRWLRLESNRFSGEIPSEIGSLRNLEFLSLSSNRLVGPIPAEIVNLSNLREGSGLHIIHNGLYTSDPMIESFIDDKSGTSHWEGSQTVAPVDLSVEWRGDHSMGLRWIQAEPGADETGVYEVFYAPSGTTNWVSAGWTSSKTRWNFSVSGLNPGADYVFAVRTVTYPHSMNENNAVKSDLSVPVTRSTTNNGTGIPRIIIRKGDPVTLSAPEGYSAYLWSTGETTSSINVSPSDAQWYWVKVTTAEGFIESASILVEAGEDAPPTAFFSYDLTGPQLSLVDQSVDGPTDWAWSFGDGATSSEQNPVHTYASEGMYTVDLQVTNDVGSDTYSIQLVVDDGGGGFTCDPIWVAAAASAGGLNETQWATDLGINNLGSVALRYAFQVLPRGANNTGEELGEVFTLESNTSVVYTDIWSELTGDEGAGAINVCVDNLGQAGVTTRTFNTGDSGTFGQTIVGMRDGGSELIGPGERARIGFLFENDEFRTNIGFMNAGTNAISIDVEFFTNDGNLLGSDSINLAPQSNRQWNQAFRRTTTDDVAAGYVDVWSDTPGASFLSYASMVDNATGDPTTIWPFEPGEAPVGGECRPIWIAAAASAGGLNDTQWATDLGINNLGSDPMSFRFQMLPRGQDNSDSEMSDTFTLGGDMGVAYADVWSEMTGAEGAGSLSVCVDSGGIAGVTSRTYNTGNEGTFGQIIVGQVDEAQHLIGQGEKARLGFLFQNDDFRTNIGFMNASDAAITIEVEFFDADGSPLGTDSVTLAPLSNDQWNRAFTRVSSTDVVGGFVDVWSDTPGASFLTYGSVVDQETGDPSTIWPF